VPRNHDVEPESVPADVWARADALKGYLTHEEASLLWRYCRSPWCEVGTYCGRSATVLAARGRGYCVDLFEDWYAGEAADALADQPVVSLRGHYADVVGQVPDGLEFLHLDADHEYAATYEAFAAYAPKLKSGGHVALHDALELHPGILDWPGVNDFAAAVLRDDHPWQLVAAAHRTIVFRKLA